VSLSELVKSRRSGLSIVERYDICDEEDYKGATTKLIEYCQTKKRPLQFGGKDGIR
jgi:hypothetical protein